MGGQQSKGVYYSPWSESQYVVRHDGAARQLRQAPGKQSKCLSKPAFAEPRGFALSVIYGVPQSQLNLYPPNVYSQQHAIADIEACKRGQVLPHHDRVVRVDKVVGARDPRVYALMKYHGYSKRDFNDPRLLEILPYSAKNAQIDIATYAKTGRPYYTVVKHASLVLDPKRGTARNWRHHGFHDGYKYDLYDPAAEKQELRYLGNMPAARFDFAKYPRTNLGNGHAVHTVPCTSLPATLRKAMCKPGDKSVPYVVPHAPANKRSNNKPGAHLFAPHTPALPARHTNASHQSGQRVAAVTAAAAAVAAAKPALSSPPKMSKPRKIPPRFNLASAKAKKQQHKSELAARSRRINDLMQQMAEALARGQYDVYQQVKKTCDEVRGRPCRLPRRTAAELTRMPSVPSVAVPQAAPAAE